MSTKKYRWDRNRKEAQFIVQQTIAKKFDIDNPNYNDFLKTFPSFHIENKKNFRRNFLNTVSRWRKFIQQKQGEKFNYKLYFFFTDIL